MGGFARSVEAQHLLRAGWAREIAAPREVLRARAQVSVAEAGEREHGTRMPRAAYDLLRRADGRRAGARADAPVRLRAEPGLRALPYAGPLPGLLRPARAHRSPTEPPACRWCGTAAPDWACPSAATAACARPCSATPAPPRSSAGPTPATPVRTSAGDQVRATVPDKPAIVVATPGAEPVAEGGYAAVVLLDTWLPLARADLRAEEEALRRWLNAAGGVRPGGRVLAVGPSDHPALQALVRWDPAGFAERETAQRAEAHLPPASRLATVTGEPGAVDDALTLLEGPDGTEVLGPVPVDDGEVRAVVRVPRGPAPRCPRALGELQRVRSARKLDAVRVQVDPFSL